MFSLIECIWIVFDTMVASGATNKVLLLVHIYLCPKNWWYSIKMTLQPLNGLKWPLWPKKVQSDLRNETRDEFYIIWVLDIAYINLVLSWPNGPRYLGNPRQHEALAFGPSELSEKFGAFCYFFGPSVCWLTSTANSSFKNKNCVWLSCLLKSYSNLNTHNSPPAHKNSSLMILLLLLTLQ